MQVFQVNRIRLENRSQTRSIEYEAQNNSTPSETKNFEQRRQIVESCLGLRLTRFAQTLLVKELITSSNYELTEIPAVHPAARSFQVRYSKPISKSKDVLWYPDRPPWVVNLIEEDNSMRLVCTCAFIRRYQLPCRHLLAITGGVFSLSDIHYRYLLDYVLGYLDLTKLTAAKRGVVVRTGFPLTFPFSSSQDTESVLYVSDDEDNFEPSESIPETETSDYLVYSQWMSQCKAAFQSVQSDSSARKELMAMTQIHVSAVNSFTARFKDTPTDPTNGVQDPCNTDRSKGPASSKRLRAGAEITMRKNRKKVVKVVVGKSS